MVLDIYKILFDNPSIYLKINPCFIKRIHDLIIDRYGSLRNFNKEKLKINYATLKYEFWVGEYHHLARILKIIEYIDINREDFIDNIVGFRASGSHGRDFVVLLQCNSSLRKERKNMWSIYIGAKQLEKFYNEIGFGIHTRRQKILENAVSKKLRVNQYI